jgi:two-component system response regulator ResD
MTETPGASTNRAGAAKDVVPLGAVRPSRDDVPRVLIVDDDPLLANVVSRYLQRHGLETEWASDGPAAVAAIERDRPDLVLLDVMLPGRDGHHVCRDLRARWNLPVLMLTALGDEDARVAGFEAGADDYVCKPFSPRELLLRIRSLLRRTTSANASLSELLRDGDLALDLGRREALVGQRILPLTTREHDLLQFFLQHPGVNFTRQELLERVWGWQHGDLSTVTVHVRRLREKIEDDAARPRRLLTVFGVGYRYEYTEQR